MAQVKFYRGVRANYSSVTHADGIYFATDTHVIIMNNTEYGVSAEDISAIKGAVDGVTLTDPSTLTFSFVDETAHPDLTVKLVSYAAATDGALTFGTPDSTTKVSQVSLKLNANDKVLTKDTNGLLTNISLSYDSTNKLIKLLGKDVDDGQGGTAPAVISSIDATDFIKDGMIDSVELVTNPSGQPAGTYIKITFNTAAGKDPIFLDVTTLIDVYTAGNGLQLSGSEFSIKLADDNEGTYLQVGSGGLKITGIAAIQTQVTNIINSVGLGASEAYTNTGTYIGQATTNTVTSDIKALDTAAAGKADKVASATAGNFAGLDSNGNLVDSGAKAADFKTKQTAVSDPSADGTGLTFIDAITQDTNGVITPHKKTVQTAQKSTSGVGGQDGLMTAAMAEKLDGIADGAEVNTIEGVQVNGSDLTPDANDKVNITITEGSTNGTVAVNGSDVSVHGLGSAAFEDTTAFDAAGTAQGLIEALDATPSQAAGADGLALSLTEVDGVVTGISGSIAANTYDAYGDAAAVLGQSTDAYTDNTVYGAKKYAEHILEWNEVTA